MTNPRPKAARAAARTRLRRLLEREGSYPAIASAAASGELGDALPTRIFSHIGDVYDRLELAAGPDFPNIALLRLIVSFTKSLRRERERFSKARGLRRPRPRS